MILAIVSVLSTMGSRELGSPPASDVVFPSGGATDGPASAAAAMCAGPDAASVSTSTSTSPELDGVDCASPSIRALLVDVDRIFMLHIGHRRSPCAPSSSESGSAAMWRLTCSFRHASWIPALQHFMRRQARPPWSRSSRHRGHWGRAMA